ncbi:hypothetical protein [Winslowiella iniecta]|uniref:Uncharacterized protein n=1 Tax=Winslowiella iniecta TaxID=1560201 RepID=A0A0L7SYU9_9GAMM|nr:hypothetical protein [Winslowiella iniecta]KOC88151.1 hypothetical protein NG43_20650 [Winslowiella iniecta]KOC88154.1 hypothetical protein NG42_17290 [Winslowiella iniecta]
MKVIKITENNDGFTMDSSAYPDYVDSIKGSVPENALQYMMASWHYDHRDPKCLHDSRIEKLCILESNSGDFRVTDIKLLLQGAYGNRMCLSYSNVFSYSIEKKKCEWPVDDYSHGDWLIDEIILSDDGFLMHEIIFTDAVINIKHKDVQYDVI